MTANVDRARPKPANQVPVYPSPDVQGRLLTRADDLYADEERQRRHQMTERSIARAAAAPA